MATWTVELEASSYFSFANLRVWLLSAGSRPQVPAALVPVGTDRFLQGVALFTSSHPSTPNTFGLEISENQTDDSLSDLSNLWETQGSIHLISGSDEVTYNVAGSDTADPYNFTDNIFGVFADALAARTGDQSATLTLDDGDDVTYYGDTETEITAIRYGNAETEITAIYYGEDLEWAST